MKWFMAWMFSPSYLAVEAICSVLAGRIMFLFLQGEFPTVAKKHRRQDAGLSTVLGAMTGAIWFIGLPMIFCFTGFAQHGIWRPKVEVPPHV